MHLEIILWYSRPPRKSTLCRCCCLCRKNCSKRFKIRILQCLNTSVIHCRPHLLRKMVSSADVFEFYDITTNYRICLFYAAFYVIQFSLLPANEGRVCLRHDFLLGVDVFLLSCVQDVFLLQTLQCVRLLVLYILDLGVVLYGRH